MAQGHVVIHLVFFIAITCFVLPDRYKHSLRVSTDDEVSGKWCRDVIEIMQWSHLITFILLMLKMTLKVKGYNNLATLLFALVAVSFGVPISYLYYMYKIDEFDSDLVFWTPGIRANRVFNMFVIEMIYMFLWLVSISFHLLFFYCTGYVSPFTVEEETPKYTIEHSKNLGGGAFWQGKNCDDFLRYVSRQTFE